MAAEIQPFVWDENDPLATEHALVSAALADAKFGTFEVVEKDFTSASKARRTILEASGVQLSRFTAALFARRRYLDETLGSLGPRSGAFSPELLEQWRGVERSRDRVFNLVGMDLKWRQVQFNHEQVVELLSWAEKTDRIDWLERPLKAMLRCISGNGLENGETRKRLKVVSEKCAACAYAEARIVGRRIEGVLFEFQKRRDIEKKPPLKRDATGIDPGQANGTERVREKAADLLRRANEAAHRQHLWKLDDILTLPASQELLKANSDIQIAAVLLTANQALGVAIREKEKLQKDSETWEFKPRSWFWNLHQRDGFPKAGMEISRRLLQRKLPLSDREVGQICEDLGSIGGVTTWTIAILEPIVSLLEKRIRAHGKSEFYVQGMKLLHEAAGQVTNAPERKLCERLERLMEIETDTCIHAGPGIPLQKGEAWSDAAIGDIRALDLDLQLKWSELLEHCFKASSGSASRKWLKVSQDLVLKLGKKEFLERVLKWFELVDRRRTEEKRFDSRGMPDPNELIIDPHMDVLRGLAWCSGFFVDREVARGLANLARSCYRKIQSLGPRATRVGNAAVTALGMMHGLEGVYQLSYLKMRVKFGTAQKMIEKAFDAAAKRAELPRQEIEEMAVPSYGLTEVGVGEEEFGDFAARLKVAGTDSTELEWRKKDGKALKAVPAEVKARFGKEWKEFQGQVKDIQRMLPAQRERMDGMFLQQRVWPVGVWRERYLDHSLVGTLARRILWEFGEGIPDFKSQSPDLRGAARTGIWYEGRLVDLDLREIELKEGMSVRLWHPIGKELEEVMAWREWLEAQRVQQPFKQAHREIYLLTDAELRTGTYSNRFAAHIVKQHQFNALCAARGWKNKLRLMVDAEYAPPTLLLPQWGLRAEFWVEGIGEDYGTDTAESGAYLRLATDQTRFYRMDAAQRSAHAGGGGYRPDFRREDGEPIPLREVPALVFSEVMRDVDLFVGVASVGNDPTWSDGGPNGRFVDYWQSYSFGELNASAQTRKEVLRRLIPKLKIARVCEFEEKFLVVKGSIRAYRIHLGSGNILMKPNDQYLCIVPKQGALEDGSVMLPFEGDRTLSLILSKAFLLAEDEKIKDQTILSQIGSR